MTKGIALTTDSTAPSLDEIFEVLRVSAVEAGERGGALYGAQAKKHLLRVFPGFAERDYGFKKFVDLLRAGQDQGRFALEVVEGGHPRLTATTAGPEQLSPQVWLKPDLWSTMLTWDTGQRRWDRKHGRAIFLPTSETGVPLWEVSPADFVDIEPVTMEEHLGWMRTFANTQDKESAAALHNALQDPAAGAFKRELGKRRLQQAWTSYLRQRVADHAAAWAARNGVAVGSIVDVRARAAGPTPAVRPDPGKPTAPTTAAEDDLRARLHQIVDQMSLAELAALPIPAGYLIAR